MSLKTRNIGYWVATGVLAFCILSGGAAETVHFQGNVEGVVMRLGYPLYFLRLIGIWKVLGALGSVRKEAESDESFVIQGRRPDSRRGRRCRHARAAPNATVTSG
ncbi:MAG: DoxX family protein, partial [Methylocella sp.]